MNTGTITSRDGTTIAYEKTGSGAPVILVASALADRSDTTKLARLLSTNHTVFNYDRRGRGASGDTAPYDVAREVEDLDALIEEAGGSAYVFGSSSGAVLALEAAVRGLGIIALALYEPPFRLREEDERPPVDQARHVEDLVATDRRGEAVQYFMTETLGAPRLLVASMRLMPRTWSGLKAMAPTIAYDIAVMGDTQAGRPWDADRWAAASMPTLVMCGGKSPDAARHATTALADALPNAQHRLVDRLNHSAPVMAPKALAPVIAEFFRSHPA